MINPQAPHLTPLFIGLDGFRKSQLLPSGFGEHTHIPPAYC